MMWTDSSGFSLCAAPLESLGLRFRGARQNGRGRSGSPEYSRPERDGEDLESRRGQDLVANLVGNLVANLVDIRTRSTVHWWLTFITTGDCAGLQAQQGDE